MMSRVSGGMANHTTPSPLPITHGAMHSPESRSVVGEGLAFANVPFLGGGAVPGTLEGKTALVTGGGRGIGRACALELASRGAAVLVGARSEDEVGRVAKELEGRGARARAVRLDVTSEESIAKAVS